MNATRTPLKIIWPEIIYTEGNSTTFLSSNTTGYFRCPHAYHPGKTAGSRRRA